MIQSDAVFYVDLGSVGEREEEGGGRGESECVGVKVNLVKLKTMVEKNANKSILQTVKETNKQK